MPKELAEIEEAVRQLRSILEDQADVISSIPSSYLRWTTSLGFSIHDVVARSTLIYGLVSDIGKVPKEKILLVPAARFASLRDGLTNIGQQSTNFNEQLRSLVAAGGVASTDETVATAPNGSSIQVRQLLDNIWNAQDGAIDARLLIAPALTPRAVGRFSAASKALTEKASEAQELLGQLRKETATVLNMIAAVGTQATSVEESTNEVARLQQDIETRRRTIDENASAISATLATVTALGARASVLEAQVAEFEPKLTAFDESISEREKNHATSITKLSEATKSLSKTQKDLEDITEKAREVLGTATVAGLSREYADQASAVDTQVANARNAYYISVVLLVVSVMMALGLLPYWLASPLRPMPDWQAGTPTGAYVVQLLGSLGSRVLVILPSGLLAAFSSTRHSALFRLREEYNHKKGLAASIDGFKQQAPEYADAMTAAVFQELVKNPALAIDGNADHSPNGYLTKLLAPKVRDALIAMLAARDLGEAQKKD